MFKKLAKKTISNFFQKNIFSFKNVVKYQKDYKTSNFLYNEKKVLEDIKKSKFLKT